MKGITPGDIPKVMSWFDKTPAGEAMNANRKNLLTYARAKLVSGNALTGEKDPDGEYQLMQFTNDLQQAEEQQRTSGKPIGDLYRPGSPLFAGANIAKYVQTPQQIMAKKAAAIRGDNTPPAATINTTPGIVPSTANTPGAAQAPKSDLADGEVVRTTKDGRPAIYDSKTKSFKRWAK
jgi:hypothetical protein